MKRVLYLVLIMLCFMCASCNQIVPSYKENPPTNSPDSNQPEINQTVYDILPDIEYTEAPDSLSGVDVTDLSGLKNAVDKIGNNYAANTKVYFNEIAVERVIYNYKKPFYCQTTSLYNEHYIYRYNNGFNVNEGYVEHDDNVYKLELQGATLADKLNSSIKEEDLILHKESSTIYNDNFLLGKFDSEYINTHGPLTIQDKKYSSSYAGWTRISKNKYKCDRPDVIKDFLNVCTPGFDNGGTYMTFTHVTVETFENGTIRLRLYASSTQIGKLIDSHVNPTYKNWYLLFAEAEIYDINKIEPSVFENFYN